jgi:SurA-like N-terminal domain/PPIC-type PPIASE domain
MQHLMRQYKKQIIIVIAIFIIPLFVLWGGSFGKGDDSGGGRLMEPIARVGNVDISGEEFRDALTQEVQRRSNYGQRTTVEQLELDGSAFRVLESLINRAIIEDEAVRSGLRFDRELLVDKLKDQFKTEDGAFDTERWNTTVKRTDINWNTYYAMVEDQVRKELVIKRMGASARVLDKDIRDQFEAAHTTLDLRYVAIKPPVAPTDEEIQKQYDENSTLYQEPEQRRAEFVAVSLKAPKPALVDELLEKARAGEDFAALAKEHSNAPETEKEQGGDLGWLSERIGMPDYEKVLFALKPGEISDPVESMGAYYIYKVEEERESQVADQRDVRARRILIAAALTDEERAAREEQAEQLAAKAAEAGDIKAAAAEAGLQVATSGPFSVKSTEVEGLPQEDVGAFRTNLATVDAGGLSGVVTARSNLYVAKVTEVTPPVSQPLETVREKVREDTIRRLERSPEYARQVEDLSAEIKEKAATLEAIKISFPNLNADIEAMSDFSVQNYRFGEGPPWNPRDVYAAVADTQPGSVTGPIRDFMGGTYFVSLVSKTLPDGKAWDEMWPEEETQLRERALARAEQERIDDYLRYLREQGIFQWDQTQYLRILGHDPEAEAEAALPPLGEIAPEQDAEDTPAAEPAPAEETAPSTEGDGS